MSGGIGRQTTDRNSNTNVHTCPDCGRIYKAVETLNRHRKNHSAATEHVCSKCGASFKRKDLLDRHSQIHEGESAQTHHRSQSACSRCSRLKTKCDGSRPACSKCAHRGLLCSYSGNRTRARTRRSSTERKECRHLDASESPKISPDTNVGLRLSSYGTLTDSADFAARAGSTLDDMGLFSADYQMAPALMLEALPPAEPLDVSNSSYFQSGMLTADMLWHYPTEASQSEGRTAAHATRNGDTILNFHEPDYGCTNMADPVIYPDATASAFDTGWSPHAPLIQEAITQDQVVSRLMQAALNFGDFFHNTQERTAFWQQASRDIEIAFQIQSATLTHRSFLEHCMVKFFEHLHNRGPIIYEPGTDPNDFPPYLYLTFAGMGSALMGSNGPAFHERMLHMLRVQLSRAASELELPAKVLFPLTQSLSYLHAAILYFGHTSMFPFLSQLGSLCVSLGRKLDIFNETGLRETEELATRYTCRKPSSMVMEAEGRRRLAFCIARLDVFDSLLLGTRPAVSSEEINLHYNASDFLWITPKRLDQANRAINCALKRESSVHFYSDLVRLALDKEEQLPCLRIDELHMVLYGLQSYVWRFSLERGVASRFALDFSAEESSSSDNDFPNGPGDLLANTRHRTMRDYRSDYKRVLAALAKWKGALTANVTDMDLEEQRDSLLSSRLLYNNSFMRLRSDLPLLHSIALSCIKNQSPSDAGLSTVLQWTQSKAAATAVHHACSAWCLVHTELQRPISARANFNIMTQIALLNAAVIVWAYAGAQRGQTSARLDMRRATSGRATEVVGDGLELCRGNVGALMSRFADLVREVMPLWSPGSSRYHVTVSALAERVVPLAEL